MFKKILVIKLGALGDFVLATGQCFTVQKMYPDAQIDLLTGPSLVKMARQMGIFDQIYADARTNFKPCDWYRICKKIIADGQYDLIVDFQNSTRTRTKYPFIANLFSHKKLNWQFPHSPIFEEVTFDAPRLDFCQGEEKNFHLLPQRYVIMFPGCSASNVHKRWPKEKYAQLAQKLAERKIASVIVGTSDERAEIDYITQSCEIAVNFMNKASLLDIPKMSQMALCAVGNDTGPTHMASFVGTPSVVLFCRKTENSANHLDNVTNLVGEKIEDISVEQVLQSIEQFSILP